jgi:hypothetical protein
MKPLKIFISAPLSNGGQADNETMMANMEKAVLAGIECIKKGQYPFIPHLHLFTHTLAESQGLEIPWQTWMDIDDAFLHCCDAILCLGSSKGSNIELSVARDMKIPIYYSVDEVPDFKSFVVSSFEDSPY